MGSLQSQQSPQIHLPSQLEEFDAELEGLQAVKTRKGAKPAPRLVHLEESVLRHRTHIARLEQLLRLMENDAVAPDEVLEVKDLVDDYIERNQEDFDDFDTPDDVYESVLETLENLGEGTVPLPGAVVAPLKVHKHRDSGLEFYSAWLQGHIGQDPMPVRFGAERCRVVPYAEPAGQQSPGQGEGARAVGEGTRARAHQPGRAGG